MFKKIQLFIFIMIFLPTSVLQAAGASLFFSPATGTYGLNTSFDIAVLVGSGSENINAAEGNMAFDKDKLEVISISKSGSIFSLWTNEPNFSNSAGMISFGGGVISPGYKGEGGKVLTIRFKTKQVGDVSVVITSGAVLANDGHGTNVLASIGGGRYVISPAVVMPDAPKSEEVKDEGAVNKDGNESQIEEGVPSIIDLKEYNQESWLNNRNFLLTWEVPQGVTDVSFSFDNKKESDPGNKGQGRLISKEYSGIADGEWYFHLKFKDQNGWAKANNYKLKIDSAPPVAVNIKIEQEDSNDWPRLVCGASDSGSGINRYEINVGSLEERSAVTDAADCSLKISDLEVGPHVAMVKAIDQAGNTAYSTINFDIKPLATPEIKNYSKEIKETDQFFISGSSLPDVKIKLFIEDGNGKIVEKATEADKNGAWFLVGDERMANGRYVAWVEAVNKNNLKSMPTEKISFLVTPPIFARIGNFIVNYFTVIASLLFIILLTIIAGIYLAEMIRKKLKKETIDVEKVLHANLEKLRNEVDDNIAELNKFKNSSNFTKERIKTKKKIVKKINEAEIKIMKEVKDIEKILK